MRIAITGASGFAGGSLCRTLAAEGDEILAFGRRATTTSLPGIAYRSWDIAAGPLSGPPKVDAVIHCAGTVSDWGPATEFFATNEIGTHNVLESFPAATFVHISTGSVYDPYQPTVMATEDAAPTARYLNSYGASKAAAERVVLSAMAHRPAIILRPHAIYGPGDTTLLPRILSAVGGRRLIAVGDGRQRISLTSMSNLATACRLAVHSGLRQGVFNITDAQPLTLDEALRWILAERQIDATPFYVALKVLWPLAIAMEHTHRLTRRAKPPRLTRYALSHLAVERTFDLGAARRELGFSPSPTSFDGAARW